MSFSEKVFKFLGADPEKINSLYHTMVAEEGAKADMLQNKKEEGEFAEAYEDAIEQIENEVMNNKSFQALAEKRGYSVKELVKKFVSYSEEYRGKEGEETLWRIIVGRNQDMGRGFEFKFYPEYHCFSTILPSTPGEEVMNYDPRELPKELEEFLDAIEKFNFLKTADNQ
jgi:hypothetical protein